MVGSEGFDPFGTLEEETERVADAADAWRCPHGRWPLQFEFIVGAIFS
jgi:hypothetical protein